jgi:hypothetical protein
VNTLGGLYGKNKVFAPNMTEVGIFKKDSNGKITVYNWNGKPSPVVHQYDRFSEDYFGGRMGIGVLSSFEGVVNF